MSLLSYMDLLDLQKKGIIENSLPQHVNSASIDVTLGANLLVERSGPTKSLDVVSLRDREQLKMREVSLLVVDSYVLQPGEFILAQSDQLFNLPPWLSCEYKLKSSMARIGLEHLNAGWCDSGWHGSVLTLELKNMTRSHAIRLHKGDHIGQMVFFKHDAVPDWASYATRGGYNNDKTVQAVKP